MLVGKCPTFHLLGGQLSSGQLSGGQLSGGQLSGGQLSYTLVLHPTAWSAQKGMSIFRTRNLVYGRNSI